jgi:hypothetical protein
VPSGAVEGGITMLGAPSTGKTTFLAALSVALIQQNGTWRIRGVEKADADALTKLTMELNERRMFPDATASIEQYRWELIGTTERTERKGLFRRDKVTETVTIPLDLVDAAGGSAHPFDAGPVRWEALIDNLERSRGIIFLFDPVREFEKSDAFIHTVGVINELNQRMRDRSLPDGRLPHYVAVCIAKFDEVRVLRTAQRLGMVYYDSEHPGCPRVHDDEAREFFTHLCDVSESDEARMVPNLLTQTFSPKRIRYFVTSAIGFYVDRNTGVFDPNDFQNHLPGQTDKESRIRGAVDPINVVEPMLWLGQYLSRGAWR